MATKYDVIIIGAGPAGLTAGIYTTRNNLKTLIIECLGVGGQINYTAKVDNYTGLENISSFELIKKMQAHAENLGVEILYDSITDLNLLEHTKQVTTEYSGTMEAPVVIISAGCRPRELCVKGEDQFLGRGVHYCAVCDGAFYKDKNVVVVGGGNTAFEDAMLLSNIAKDVTLINILPTFQANQNYQQKAATIPNLHLLADAQVTEIYGEENLQGIKYKKDGVEHALETDGVFVCAGRRPNSETFADVEKDAYGYLLTNEDMETNLEGVFACGDIRQKKVRQIITACGDGAIAGTMAGRYILEFEK